MLFCGISLDLLTFVSFTIGTHEGICSSRGNLYTVPPKQCTVKNIRSQFNCSSNFNVTVLFFAVAYSVGLEISHDHTDDSVDACEMSSR